ncbi:MULTISPECIES: hypothetical protein [Brevibacterium]|nr:MULTISPECIES: hypothetical protein [Brevibacterium]MDN5587132.1 hypothetical protein [Brevibacterium sp.]MDN5587366.1 hypothetical protein [Brevibacterium sp.]MDN5634570.1 hypothetical protein [Brevibacterium sp.]MDN5656420.1 hypothetical protein [Brevibacterium sandarakinum]
MNIPTGLEMDAINHTMLVNRVLSSIKQQRPDLSEHVSHMSGSPAVGVKLQLSRDRSIMFAWVRDKSVVQWMIATPDQTLTPLRSGETVDDIASRLIEAFDRFAD